MGILDNEYAAMVGAPSAFRDVAESLLATATLQHQNDQQALKDLQAKFDTDEQIIGTLQTNFTQAATDLAKAQSDLKFMQGVENKLEAQLTSALAPLGDILILRDLQKMNDPVTGWQPPQVSVLIGGNPPAAYTRTWDANGNLVLNTTGKASEYDDWLTGLHIPNVIKPTTRGAIVGWNFTVDANQQFVQCHEQDALFPTAAGFFNGSAQWNAAAGQIQIEAGPDANGKGSWMNCGIPVPRLAAGHHSLEIIYGIDQAAKTIQYAAISIDGVRNVIPASVGVRKAFPPKWTFGTLTLQAQEDANQQGGSFQTTFDSIWAVIL